MIPPGSQHTFRAWWSSYSSAPDEDTANAAPTAQPASAAEGTTSLVNRFRATAAAAAAVPATTTKPNPEDDAPITETVIFDLDEGTQDGDNGAEEDISEAPQTQERAADGAPPAEGQNGDGPGTSTSGGFVKPGRLAALIKAVESSHNSGSSVKVEKEALGQAATPAQGTAGGPDKLGDKEETGFLSGLFRRLSIEHGPAGDAEARAPTETAPLMKIVLSPAEKTGVGGEQAETPALSPFARASPEKLSAREIFDPLPQDPPESVQADSDKRENVEQKGSDASLDAAAGDGSGGGGAESLNLVLPEAVEVLMHALQRAQSPSVLARPLLQLESAVAWLPAASAHDGHGGGRSGKRDFGGRGPSTEDDGEGSAPRSTGKAVGSGSSGAPAGGPARGAHKGKDGGDRERNAEALMARPGWLAWCHRLVEALSARNESGDLVPGRSTTGYAYGGNDGDLGGSERWAAGGSEASEAGGYLDDSHSGGRLKGPVAFAPTRAGRTICGAEGCGFRDKFKIFSCPAFLRSALISYLPRTFLCRLFIALEKNTDTVAFHADESPRSCPRTPRIGAIDVHPASSMSLLSLSPAACRFLYLRLQRLQTRAVDSATWSLAPWVARPCRMVRAAP